MYIFLVIEQPLVTNYISLLLYPFIPAAIKMKEFPMSTNGKA
jgi:hypothetical protein